MSTIGLSLMFIDLSLGKAARAERSDIDVFQASKVSKLVNSASEDTSDNGLSLIANQSNFF